MNRIFAVTSNTNTKKKLKEGRGQATVISYQARGTRANL
jgi:hypothetical protein